MADGQEPMVDADGRGPAAGSREQTGAMGRFTMAIDNEYPALIQPPDLALFRTLAPATDGKTVLTARNTEI